MQVYINELQVELEFYCRSLIFRGDGPLDLEK